MLERLLLDGSREPLEGLVLFLERFAFLAKSPDCLALYLEFGFQRLDFLMLLFNPSQNHLLRHDPRRVLARLRTGFLCGHYCVFGFADLLPALRESINENAGRRRRYL